MAGDANHRALVGWHRQWLDVFESASEKEQQYERHRYVEVPIRYVQEV